AVRSGWCDGLSKARVLFAAGRPRIGPPMRQRPHTRPTRCRLLLAACGALTLSAWAATGAAATGEEPAGVAALRQPTTHPTTRPTMDQVPALVEGLVAPQPAERARARSSLMLLSRDDLPALRETLADRVPLRPALRAAVREVVM